MTEKGLINITMCLLRYDLHLLRLMETSIIIISLLYYSCVQASRVMWCPCIYIQFFL